MRKKAKYLHDAPPEALRPVLGPNYNPNAATPTRPNGHRHPSSTASDASSTVGTYFSHSNSASYPIYSSAQTPVATLPESMAFPSQPSPVSPTFQGPGAGTPLGTVTIPQVSGDMSSFSPALFDPNNPMYNFNFDGMGGFGSQYVALEFGMLGHLSSGAGENPSRDPSLSQQGTGSVSFDSAGGAYSNGASQQLYDGGLMGDMMSIDAAANGLYSQSALQHGLPHAYAIAAGPTGLQSPSTETESPQPTGFVFDGSPTTAGYAAAGGGSSGPQPIAAPPKARTKPPSSMLIPPSVLGKRQRDSSFIYESVKEPYTYVAGFHKLISVVKRRFSPNNTLRIAKSLSSIRPSFIACTKTLNTQDLIFMEKSFQRSLFQLEDYMVQCSSPAIVCRRSGEVAAVNKEFTALTGWTKDVLLGKEPNLNVNTGAASGTTSGEDSGRAGLSTPHLKSMNDEAAAASATSAAGDEGKPQPVFMPELMDDESVIQFYEDYAHLAYGDSRGSVRRKGKLLKYRTQEMLDTSATASLIDETLQKPQSGRGAGVLGRGVAVIDSAHGIAKIERDGKLDCTYCWHIRRDTFDIPMLIVLNVGSHTRLPCVFFIFILSLYMHMQALVTNINIGSKFLPCYDSTQEHQAV